MKKFKKKSNKQSVIKELAEQFTVELDSKLPLTILPNGQGVLYKDYLVKENKQGNWALYNYKQQHYIDQFYLKTCAIMAAKAYSSTNLETYFEIKHLDNCYWANHCNTLVYKNNIKTAKDLDRYIILLNRLEDSETKESFYKGEISKKFKWSFV